MTTKRFKRFYFKEEVIKRSKMYGYLVKEVSIYYLDREGCPHLIDRIQYQTGCTPGVRQEVFNYLCSKGYIPKKFHGDYYGEACPYKTIKLFEMF